MLFRSVRFGAITLETNGYEFDRYQARVGQRNLSEGQRFGPNWEAQRLRDRARAQGTPLDDLDRASLDEIAAEANTRLSEDDLARIDRELLPMQRELDEEQGFDESQGFFTDFTHAWLYAQGLAHVGYSALERIRPNLMVMGRGAGAVTSPAGRAYPLNAVIGIAPELDKYAFHVDLGLPYGPGQLAERRRLHGAMALHAWPDGLAVEADIAEELTPSKPHKKILEGYLLVPPGREAIGWFTHIPENLDRVTLYRNPLHLESLCDSIVKGLDEFPGHRGFSRDPVRPPC